ncbi:MAG: CoB--CoM heterodisulfide reductase iron-sulfur subunit B family protein [Proteobacteria bacterium]|nr:CoB--CoM heterodisulfide reductase iron-sulfur subunit B family protein [Pseudomonadota bacterium]
MREVTYYPGCSLHGTAREYDESFRGVSGLLGVGLHELEDWTCCGSTSAHCTDEALSVALPARNLSLAEKHEREMVVPCVACYSRFRAAEAGAKAHPEYLLFPYEGKARVRYALDFFCDASMFAELGAKVARPLSGLKVACYYGCLAVRPPELTGVERYENPEHMDQLMGALGAEAVSWSYKTDCCGASLVMTRTDIVVKLSQMILSMALEAGADCIVTGCTMCHANLDTRQAGLPVRDGRSSIPVFYFTELMGLAMGHREARKWLSRHVVDPIKLLENKGLL